MRRKRRVEPAVRFQGGRVGRRDARDHRKPCVDRFHVECRASAAAGVTLALSPRLPPSDSPAPARTPAGPPPWRQDASRRSLIRHAHVPSGSTTILVSTGPSPVSSAVITMKPSSLTLTPARHAPNVAQRNRRTGSACHAAAAASCLHSSPAFSVASRNAATAPLALPVAITFRWTSRSHFATVAGMEIQNQVSRILRDNLARLRDVLDGAVSQGVGSLGAGR